MQNILALKACAFLIFQQDPYFFAETLSSINKFLMNDKEFPFLVCVYNRGFKCESNVWRTPLDEGDNLGIHGKIRPTK